MNVKLNRNTEKLVKKLLKRGYDSPEHAVLAALVKLESEEPMQFPTGHLQALVDEAEQDIKKHGTLDGPTVFAELRQRRKKRKAS